MVTRLNVAWHAALLVLLGVAQQARCSADEAPRPNIILILCDDLGYADVGFNGAKEIVTPQLDALAKRGTVCSSAYVTHPFCGPSRMGMLAGRYPHAFGAPFNLPPTGTDFKRYDDQGIPVDQTLIGTVLQKAGYYTGAIGKWHLGFAPQFHPNARGFDDFYGFLGGGHQYFPERYGPIYERQKRSGKTRFNEYITPLEHNGNEVQEHEYMTDALSREAVRFIKDANDNEKKFFLYLSYNAPHTPLEAKEEDLDRFAHLKDSKRRTYAAMVYAVDRGVGRIVEALQESGTLDDTLIVFLSDNGGKIGGGADNGPLSRGKGSVCEGGVRVPMFFHWPGQVPAGESFTHPISSLDLYPTFAKLAGATVPSDQKLDGRDIWKSLIQKRNARADESLFFLRHWNGFHNVGIRRDQWKALKRGPKSAWQLFNLNEDIRESQDVSGLFPTIMQSMIEEAASWSKTHTRPRWFITEQAEAAWREKNMPVYTSTFVSEEKEVPKKTSPTDWTLSDWIAREKVKWAKNGWRWNLEKVEAAFRDIDTDINGLASAAERRAWYAKKAAERAASSSGKSANRNRPTGKPNVLFIAIDDLRPELGCYGSKLAITPHLDGLAKDGLLFERAYCQQAICSPSRASLMTGARPDTIGVIENTTYFRDRNPNIVTLPQHFWANGYETVNVGKVYHGKFDDAEKSWSRRPAKAKLPNGRRKPIGVGGYALEENQKLVAEKRERFGANAHSALLKGPAYEAADVRDQTFEDGYNTDVAIATMTEMVKQGQQPFFLGLGYKKPHLNFVCPKRYWDLYDRTDIPEGTVTVPPKEGAAMGLHASFELRVRHGIPRYGSLSPEVARTLLHGYLACTSYVDAQIGRAIAALDELGIRDNTIIVVWGDHGWHLGEMGIWGKATNYEIATRVPLIVCTPKMPDEHRGNSTTALVELVDLYPTLCDLTGLEKPSHLEGHSYAPLLAEPDRPWKAAAFSQYPNPALREWAANPITAEMRKLFFGPLIRDVEQAIIDQQQHKWDRTLFEQHLMGYAMRTDRYRLVAWQDHRSPEAEPLAIELYDHEVDPEETMNIAVQQPDIVRQLLKQMASGWKSAFDSHEVHNATR
ncbi:MAG: sulfatase-like hydrolase/transferase [Planctomycetota bacterium]